MNYVWLALMSAFALDWFCRMIRWAEAHDERVYHIGTDWLKPVERGKHQR